jgi:hypothetical protein
MKIIPAAASAPMTSAYVLTSAASGNHYDLGLDDISFCPLSLIDRDAERHGRKQVTIEFHLGSEVSIQTSI